MQFFYIILMAVMATSCGVRLKDIIKKKGNRPILTTHRDFIPYINRFNGYAERYGMKEKMNIPVVFSTVSDSEYVGVCNIYEDGEKSIEIKKTYWDNQDLDTRESLLLHELGHCFLNRRNHVKGTVNSYKKSLLHESVVQGSIYKRFQGYYLHELFRPESSPIFPDS